METDKLKKILELHKLWLDGDSKGERANLARAYLTCANLTGANLARANLTGANLTCAYLTDANLTGANLTGANLARANLARANLTGANLTGANLARAYLTGANLTDANLARANLTGANLTDASLADANLARANLPYASIVPEVGAFTAFKKLRSGAIATLLVPAKAKRLGGLLGRKCRVSEAKVIAISSGLKKDVDAHAGKTVYQVGKTVKPDKFDDDIRRVCTSGIHCFITRKEAEDY